MRCQEFFLTRFIIKCLIFVFFLNCVITAEAGMVLGLICFPEGSEKKEDTGSGVSIYFITSKTIEERRDVIDKECTIEKVCKDNCLPGQICKDDCPPGQIKLPKIQLIRLTGEISPNCYHYKVFISPGRYRIQCDNNKCSSDRVISHYGSSQRDINFTISGKLSKCEESPVTQHIETSHE